MSSARAVSAAVLALAAAILLAGAGGAAAQPSTSECTQTLLSMSPCLGYITNNETAPPEKCCTQLGTVAKSQPECLCAALAADPASLGLTVNRTRALGLPDTCKVQTPPLSDCKGAASPTAPSSGTPAGTGSKTTPTTDVRNGGEQLRWPGGLVAGLVVAVVYAAVSGV